MATASQNLRALAPSREAWKPQEGEDIQVRVDGGWSFGRILTVGENDCFEVFLPGIGTEWFTKENMSPLPKSL
jgi:hypothetical protein